MLPSRLSHVLVILLTLAVGPAFAQAQDCGAEQVAAKRRDFQTLYEARKFAAARDLLDEVWTACFIERPDGERAAAVAGDLAIAAHRAGDSDRCLQVLSDFLPGLRDAERRLAALPERMRKAILFNVGLCEKGCRGRGPGCLMARAARAHLQFDRADFVRAQACGFAAGEGAVAVAADICLQLLEPRQTVDLGARATAKPAVICPRVALVRKGAPSREQALPASSWLRHVDICCAAAEVATDARGRVRIAPAENPPEGCLHGRRNHVAEDIYVIEGGVLRLQSRVQIGVW